jgi:hypothetical protein
MDVEIHKLNAIFWASLQLFFHFTNGRDINIMVVMCGAKKAKWCGQVFIHVNFVFSKHTEH